MQKVFTVFKRENYKTYKLEILIKIIRPFTLFLGFLLTKWYEFDIWWNKKTILQKGRYRSNFIIISLIGIIVYLIVKSEVDKKLLKKDYTNELNNCNSELNEVRKEEKQRMKLEIEKKDEIESAKIKAEKKADSLAIVLQYKK